MTEGRSILDQVVIGLIVGVVLWYLTRDHTTTAQQTAAITAGGYAYTDSSGNLVSVPPGMPPGYIGTVINPNTSLPPTVIPTQPDHYGQHPKELPTPSPTRL